jgi:hypothetical protein
MHLPTLASPGDMEADGTFSLYLSSGGADVGPSCHHAQGLRGQVAASIFQQPLSSSLTGHETSANHLAFTVMELSRQPEIVAR